MTLALKTTMLMVLTIIVLGIAIFAGFQVWAAVFPPDHTLEELGARIDVYTCGTAHILGQITQGQDQECNSELSVAGFIPITIEKGTYTSGLIIFGEEGEEVNVAREENVLSWTGPRRRESQITITNPMDGPAVCIYPFSTVTKDHCIRLAAQQLTVTTPLYSTLLSSEAVTPLPYDNEKFPVIGEGYVRGGVQRPGSTESAILNEDVDFTIPLYLEYHPAGQKLFYAYYYPAIAGEIATRQQATYNENG